MTEIHEAKRKFSCEECGQPFKRKDHLNKHLKRHAAGLRRKRPPQKSSTRVYPALEQVEDDNEFLDKNNTKIEIREGEGETSKVNVDHETDETPLSSDNSNDRTSTIIGDVDSNDRIIV